MWREDDKVEFSPDRDEQVRMLRRCADTLRRLRTGSADDVPVEFVFMSMAHLLEELSRSLEVGQSPSEHTIDAALEIARHVGHRNP